MKGKKLFLMLAVALGCSGLAWLGASVAQPNVTVLAAPSTPGQYILSCLMDLAISGIQPCMSGNQIPVGTELVLKAHVQDSFGIAATRGAVIFQDCSLRGIPAPSAACKSGSGAWSHVITLSLDTNGDAEVDYGFVSTPNKTIGFRFRYIGQGSGIANGSSAPMDVTWVPTT